MESKKEESKALGNVCKGIHPIIRATAERLDFFHGTLEENSTNSSSTRTVLHLFGIWSLVFIPTMFHREYQSNAKNSFDNSL